MSTLLPEDDWKTRALTAEASVEHMKHALRAQSAKMETYGKKLKRRIEMLETVIKTGNNGIVSTIRENDTLTTADDKCVFVDGGGAK